MSGKSALTQALAEWRTWLPVVGWVIVAVVLTQALLHSLFMDLPMSTYHVLAGVIQGVLIFVPSALFVLWRRTARRTRIINEDLRRSEQLREDLTAMLVHDLKNPVITAALALDLMLDDTADEECLPDSDRAIMIGARRSLQRLEGMIGDVLAINAADNGGIPLSLQHTDLTSLIAEVAEDVIARATAEEIEIILDDLPELPEADVDREHVRRVVENLISNALAHTGRGGRIDLSACARDDEIIVSVTDTGDGIAPELSDELFERYAQADRDRSSRLGRSSVGLGLAYCKIAVEAHGGRIWAENTESGSRFSFSLPIGHDGALSQPGVVDVEERSALDVSG